MMDQERHLTLNMHVGEFGRSIMSAELTTIKAHEEALRHHADVTAVHESRKAIRRTYTAFKLFAPYYSSGELSPYRGILRKLMRRLGRCRDMTIFLQKLAQFTDSFEPLPGLTFYWQGRNERAHKALQQFLNRPENQDLFESYSHFTETVGLGILPESGITPVKVSHIATLMIYQRLAAVRAYEDYLDGASLELMHKLRVEFKELRYTLQFFAPLLGKRIVSSDDLLNRLQDVLGDMNDAVVALRMLDETPESEKPAIDIYAAAKKSEIGRLTDQFSPLWTEFNNPAWRQNLSRSLEKL